VAEATLLEACMSTVVPIDQFGDSSGQTQGYKYSLTPPANDPTGDTFETALDAADPTDANAVWFVGGDSSCGTALAGTTGGMRHAAALAGLRPRPAAARHAFVAHQP
jgi:hypothetical protein